MKPFNGLNPAEAERLAILAEECAEVVQVVGKILRHGYNSCHPKGSLTNHDLLQIELGHVQAATELLERAGDVGMANIAESCRLKHQTIAQYLHHQHILRSA